MIKEILLGLGVIGIILFLIILLLLPLLCTIILGTYLATALGLSGIVWWAFVIIFYLIIAGVLGAIA